MLPCMDQLVLVPCANERVEQWSNLHELRASPHNARDLHDDPTTRAAFNPDLHLPWRAVRL